MGLIKAALSTVSGVLSETWKDYFVCEALPDNVLLIKGTKKGKGIFDNSDVITNGSGIVVNEGQCAIIVDDGIVIEVAAEPGNYTFDTSKSPSVFDGGLQGLKDTFSVMVERFQYGGVANRSQIVYYVNTKEIFGNLFGTASPVPFKVSDPSIGLSNMQVMLKCNGEYSIKVTNPILLYKNVTGNCDCYYKDNIESALRSEFLTALAPALAKLSEQGVTMYSDIPLHNFELVDSLNEVLSSRWAEKRGISVGTIAINGIVPREEDMERIQNLQEGAVLRSAEAAAGHMAAAQAQAMRDAAKNTAGAATGFMGVNMASSSANVAGMFETAAKTSQAAGGFCPYCGKPLPADAMFCPSCGKQVK